uniref:Uncharacterized protein n=1 Tax=Acrobeloides nanus TaxID=290746 RepID=A0A914E9X3_9BILA
MASRQFANLYTWPNRQLTNSTLGQSDNWLTVKRFMVLVFPGDEAACENMVQNHPENMTTQHTQKNINAVNAAINQKGMPVHRVAASLGMKRDSVHRILKKDLRFHLYKLQMLQELEEDDSEKQVVLAEEQLKHM